MCLTGHFYFREESKSMNTDSKIQIFNYENNNVRTIEKDGMIWFIAKDVCDILELDNITEALRGLDSDELSSAILKSGGQKRFINLSLNNLKGGDE